MQLNVICPDARRRHHEGISVRCRRSGKRSSKEITAEMYLTGQGGYLFSKMFVNGKFDQKGVISSDMLTFEQVDTYFEYAAELGITLETKIKEL